MRKWGANTGCRASGMQGKDQVSNETVDPKVGSIFRRMTKARMRPWSPCLILAAALVTTAIACTNDVPEDGPTATLSADQHTGAPIQTIPNPRLVQTPSATSPVEAPRPEPTPGGSPPPGPTPTPPPDVTPTATAPVEALRPEPIPGGSPPLGSTPTPLPVVTPMATSPVEEPRPEPTSGGNPLP